MENIFERFIQVGQRLIIKCWRLGIYQEDNYGTIIGKEWEVKLKERLKVNYQTS